MLSNIVLASTTVLGLAAAAPAANCVNDVNPWHLTHIVKTESGSSTSIKFDFEDANTGLKLKTHCVATVKPNDVPLSTPYACENSSVHFDFDPKTSKIRIDRGYTNPCAGNPDYVQAFGDATLTFYKTALDTQQNAADTDVAITSSTV